MSVYARVYVYCVWKSGRGGEAWLSEREVNWGNGRWESQDGWWRGQPGEGVCRTHKHGEKGVCRADEHGVCRSICSQQLRGNKGQGPQRVFGELSEPAHARFIW